MIGTWGSSRAPVTAALLEDAPGPVVVVSPFLDDLDALAEELSAFAGFPAEVFPGWEFPAEEQSPRDDVYVERLRILKRLAGDDPPPLIAASIHSFLQPTPSKKLLRESTRALRVGDSLDLEEFTGWLVERGLRNMTAVELPGEFSLRGGILDLYAADWTAPVRVELFGDEIDSLREFDVGDQRSRRKLSQIELTLLPEDLSSEAHPAEHFPKDAWFVLWELAEIEDAGRRWLRHLGKRRGMYTLESTLKRMLRFPAATLSQLQKGPWAASCQVRTESSERFVGAPSSLGETLERTIGDDDVIIVCPSDSEIDQLTEALNGNTLTEQGRIHFHLGHLRAGFRLMDQGTTLLSGSEILRRAAPPRVAGRRLGRVIDSFLELREGDYVVHLSHGVGQYHGVRVLGEEQDAEEHLEVEFHGGTRIYVPVSKIDLVQKYVGPTKKAPKLSRVGGRVWSRRKQQAEEAIVDLASDLLHLQAARKSRPGLCFEPDSLWQRQFENAFPYRETPDQLTSMKAIKADMHQDRPMDRLICGEVGYGKTELAMRAAFKAVDNGFQAAVLVPTTILAEQHYRSFRERMKDFPFEIGVLSRFRTKSQQKQLLRGLAEGSVDVVIGTHRLVQADVDFHNLGLVVIDEEQRFGVEAKERLKVLRERVDVLTLTATPIPRT
ncbi:MAG: DEAD/DEAH box helicase, partial [Planctomycetales bacterium]